MHTSTKKTVSEAEAQELGFSSWLFWDVAKTHPTWERRLVERTDVRLVKAESVQMQLKLRVVPLAELKRRRRVPPRWDLITVTEAIRLTKGVFSVQRFPYWERVGCPFLGGKKLTVIRQDAIVKGGKRIKFVPQAKHYLRKEIREAWKTFRRMARRQGVHVDERGAIWLTSGAAHRKYGVYEQALRHWREKDYLDAKQLPRTGSGRLDKVWYYRSRGPRSISSLLKLQRPGNGHIVISVEEQVRSAEARTAASRGLTVEEFVGHPMVLEAYSQRALEQLREVFREDRQELLEAIERLCQMRPQAPLRTGAVTVSDFGEPVFVNGKPKSIEKFSQYKVIKALVLAGENGLPKDQLEAVNAAARRILVGLREDPDWARVIHMPATKGNRYRIG